MGYVGLVRVSTDRQETQRQHDALDPLCVRVFEEKVSGGKRLADRPGLRATLDYLRPEDFLTVQEADRLGRNLLDGLITLTELFQRGVKVKILDGVAAGEHTERNLVLDLALALSEDRRRDIARKTKNGLDAAARRGTKGGRPSVVTDDRRRAILARHAEGESIRQIARGVGISPAVVHGVLHRRDAETEHDELDTGHHHYPASPVEEAAPAEPASPTPASAELGPPPSAEAGEATRPDAEEAAARAVGRGELIDPDTVTMRRNPSTGSTRVLATTEGGDTVLVGFLEQHRRSWYARTPHLVQIQGHWPTRQRALLRLLDDHVATAAAP